MKDFHLQEFVLQEYLPVVAGSTCLSVADSHHVCQWEGEVMVQLYDVINQPRFSCTMTVHSAIRKISRLNREHFQCSAEF